MIDGAGKMVPHQKEVAGRWAGTGPVKWVRFEAVVPADAELFVVSADGRVQPEPPDPVRVSEAQGKVRLATAGRLYVLARGPSPIERLG